MLSRFQLEAIRNGVETSDFSLEAFFPPRALNAVCDELHRKWIEDSCCQRICWAQAPKSSTCALSRPPLHVASDSLPSTRARPGSAHVHASSGPDLGGIRSGAGHRLWALQCYLLCIFVVPAQALSLIRGTSEGFQLA